MTDHTAGSPLRDVREPYDREPDDDEIDLVTYIRVLWRHRMVIVGATLVCAAVAGAVSLSARRAYAAYAVLAINQSKVVTGTAAGATPTAAVTTASYRPILESQNLAAHVLRELELDRRGMTATGFFGSVVRIDEVRNSTVFILRSQVDDPNLAARVVNRTAELAVEASRRLNQDEALRSRDDLKAQLDDAQSRMQQAEARLLAFKTTSQLELLRKDVESSLQQRGGLLALLVQIESEKARLAKAEQELSARQRIDTVKKSIDSQPALMESARKAAGEHGEVLGLQMSDESINSTYKVLDFQIADGRTTLALLERQKEQLIDVRKLDGPKLALLTRLYDTESELSRLQMDLDLTKRVYDQVATAYQTARLQVTSRSAELQIIEPALPPDRPLPRNVVRNTAVAGMAGLFLSVLGVLIYSAFAGPKKAATS